MLPSDLNLIERKAIIEARENFWAFRQYINNPNKFKRGWWQRTMAIHLQMFKDDLFAGKRPKLLIEAPPQHGKSTMAVEFKAWLCGLNPDLKTIYGCFSDRLGVRANLKLQRILSSKKYKNVFPNTRIAEVGVKDDGTATRNREIVEFVDHDGSFRNTTVRGSVTGESMDLGILDDPTKGREEAGSQTIRDKTWDWFTDDFLTRCSEDSGLLAIATRWHVDDTLGRMRIKWGKQVKVVGYPAIAIRDEKHRKCGEALFPEHKSLQFILERKAVMQPANFEALYQRNPIIIGGNVIKIAQFGRYSVLPKLKWRGVYSDTAQKTADRNDYSVFECWGLGVDNKAYLIDISRGKWEAPDLEAMAIAFWNKHKALTNENTGKLRHFKIEDASSGTGLIQGLKRKPPFIPVVGIGGKGDKSDNKSSRRLGKYTRLMDILIYLQYVMIPEQGAFVHDFLSECEQFTADDTHLHDDQIDPLIDAVNDLLAINSGLGAWESKSL